MVQYVYNNGCANTSHSKASRSAGDAAANELLPCIETRVKPVEDVGDAITVSFTSTSPQSPLPILSPSSSLLCLTSVSMSSSSSSTYPKASGAENSSAKLREAKRSVSSCLRESTKDGRVFPNEASPRPSWSTSRRFRMNREMRTEAMLSNEEYE